MPKPVSNSSSENSGVYGVIAGLTLVFTIIAIVVLYMELHNDYMVF